MLIHLSGDLAHAATDELNAASSITQAVQNIAQARWQGDHLITGDEAILLGLSRHPRLSDTTKGVFERIREEQSQFGQLKNRLKVRIEVNSLRGEITTREQDGNVVVFVPLARFERNDIVQPTCLVAENLLDCYLYTLFSKWMALTYFQGRLPSVLKATFMPGGGDTTDRVLHHLVIQQRHFALCFTDSDRTHPSSALGQTARKCRALTLSAICSHSSLPVRAAENLLSAKQIKALLSAEHERHSLLPRLERVKHLAGTEPWLHLPFKDGVRELCGPPKPNSEAAYWHSVPTSSDTSIGDGHIFPAISSKLLAWAVDHLQNESPQDFEGEPLLRQIWESIAELVIAWTCGTQEMRS